MRFCEVFCLYIRRMVFLLQSQTQLHTHTSTGTQTCPPVAYSSLASVCFLQSQLSLDSGQGSMSTVNSTRSSDNSYGRHVPGSHARRHHSPVMECDEGSCCSTAGGSCGQPHLWSGALSRHDPPSDVCRFTKPRCGTDSSRCRSTLAVAWR